MDPNYLDVHWKVEDHKYPELKKEYMKSICTDSTGDIPTNAPDLHDTTTRCKF